MQGMQSGFVGDKGERFIGVHGQTSGANNAACIRIESAGHVNGQHGATQLIELCGELAVAAFKRTRKTNSEKAIDRQ